MTTRRSHAFAAFCSFALFLGVLTLGPTEVRAAELGVPVAPVLLVEGSMLRWTQPDNGVEVAGHNIHRGDGSYLTTVNATDRWDAAPETGSFFVTAFDATPGGAQISARSNVVEVIAPSGASGSGEPSLPDGFSCGNWPPVLSNDSRSPVTLDAQDAASAKCGVVYSDQNGDKCDWIGDPSGWRCLIRSADSGSTGGGGGQSGEPALPDQFRCGNWPPVPSNDQRNPVTADAQDAASAKCGATYSDQNRDKCDWNASPAGWRCMIFDADASGGGETGATPGDSNGSGVSGDESLRDTTQAPPRPTGVRIRDGRLEWEMPASPAYVYQLTTNNSSIDDGQPWTQREVQNDSNLTQSVQPNGGSEFSYPVVGFRAGTTFRVEAIHPWDIAVSGPRGSSSRFATMPAQGSGATISDFLSTFDGNGNSSIPGAWIGNRSDWSGAPQFVDDFSDPSVSDQWYFADESITPSYSRDQTYSRDTARIQDNKLVMTVDKDTGEYSYLGTGNNQGDGYHIDASAGTFVEASVKLDGATPADNAWWAFWLMNPDGEAYCDGVDTGSEVDIFELVPDQSNGFNSAIFSGDGACGGSGSTSKVNPQGRGFTHNAPDSLAGVTIPNYMDGDYHRLGMYYAHDRMAFYVDDVLFWEMTDPAYITKAEELSIRLTWELQNTNNPWTPVFGGNTKTSARDDDPTVLVDWVKVWEKGDGSTTPVDPTDPVDEEVGAPTSLIATATTNRVIVTWTPPVGQTPVGYNVERNGEYLTTTDTTELIDESVTPGVEYRYRVSAFFGTPDDREFGPFSPEVTVTTEAAPGVVRSLRSVVPNEQPVLFWRPPSGRAVDGYVIDRDGTYLTSVPASFNPNLGGQTWIDTDHGGRSHTYSVQAYVGDGDDRIVGDATSVFWEPGATGYLDGPGAVERLSLADGAGVRLEWTFDETVVPDGYLVRRNNIVVNDGIEQFFVDSTAGSGPVDHVYTVQAYLRDGVERVYGQPTTIEVHIDRNGLATEAGSAPVENLRVTQTRFQSELVVRWDAPAGNVTPAGYNIDRDGLFLTSVSGSPFYDANVEVGSSYRYTVRPYYGTDYGYEIAPPVSSPPVTVIAVPDQIRPDAPDRLSVTETRVDGISGLELTWFAPIGWEQGLVASYRIHRNGEVIAEVDELDAQTGLPTARRTFFDDDVRGGRPYNYSVIAIGTGGAASDRSESQFGMTTSGAIELEPPLVFVRAVENVLGATGDDAQEMGAEFYSLYLLSKTNSATEFRPLLLKFTASMTRLGASEYLTSVQQSAGFTIVTELPWESSDFMVARQLVSNIGKEAATYLTSIIDDYAPYGYEDLETIRDHANPRGGEPYPWSDWDDDRRVRFVREESVELEVFLEEENWLELNKSADRIAKVALGLLPDVPSPALGELRYVVDGGWIGGIWGSGPYSLQPGPYPTAWLLFDDATPQERLEFLGIDEDAFEFARPFIDLSEDALIAFRQSQQKRDTLGLWLSIIVTVGAAILTPYLSGFWAKATFAAFTTFMASSIAGLDPEDAFDAGAEAFLTAGVTYYVNLPDKSYWQVLTHATLAAAQADSDERRSVFVATIAASYVSEQFGEDAWEMMEPYVDLAIDLVIAAAIDGEDDLDQYAARFERLLYQTAGRELGDFVADALPDEWGSTTEALGDLAGYAVTVGGDQTKIRAHFYAETVPALAETIGDSLVDALGGEDEFLNEILNDLVVMGIRAGVDEDFPLSQAFEKLVYRSAGRFLSGELRNGLVALNDGDSNALIDGISGAVEVAITHSYDDEIRDEYLMDYLEEFFIDALVSRLPECADDENIRSRATGILRDIAGFQNAEDYENNAVSLLTDGFWLGVDLSEACGGSGSGGGTGDPLPCSTTPDVIASAPLQNARPVKAKAGAADTDLPSCAVPLDFERWLVGLNEIEIISAFDIVDTGVTERLFPTDETYVGYSVVATTRGEPLGKILGPTELFPDGDGDTGLWVNVVRNASGDIVDFTRDPATFDQFYDATNAGGRSTLDDLIAFGSGCGTAVDEFVDGIRTLLLELWNTDSIGVYLTQKWGEFEVILDALIHNPARFVEDFLKDLVRLDLLEGDPVEWAGAITCDIVLALVSAGAGGVGLKFTRVFDKAGNGDIATWKRNTDRDENSEIGLPCAVNSFPTGTPVLMADGSYQSIDLILPGDSVLAADPSTGIWSAYRVLDQWSHLDNGELATVILDDGSSVSATDDHRFWVTNRGEWIDLDEVAAGDFLLTPSGVARVGRVEVGDAQESLVWELDVDQVDTFAVSTGTVEVLVHNAGKGCAPSLIDIDSTIAEFDLQGLSKTTPADITYAWTAYADRYPDRLDATPADAQAWLRRYGQVRSNNRAGNEFEAEALGVANVIENKEMYTDSRGRDFIPDHSETNGTDVHFIEVKDYRLTTLDTTTNVGTMLEFLIDEAGDGRRDFDLYIGRETVLSARMYELIDRASAADVDVTIVRSAT